MRLLKGLRYQMQRETKFKRIHFHADVIRNALQRLFGPIFLKRISLDDGKDRPPSQWMFDTEDEFFSDYQSSKGNAYFSKQHERKGIALHRFDRETLLRINASDRQSIQAVFNIFEAAVERSRLPEDLNRRFQSLRYLSDMVEIRCGAI